MNRIALLSSILVIAIALPLIRIWVWCLADLFNEAAPRLDTPVLGLWALALLTLSIVAIPAYVSIGPGHPRWDPDMLWWPWKR